MKNDDEHKSISRSVLAVIVILIVFLTALSATAFYLFAWKDSGNNNTNSTSESGTCTQSIVAMGLFSKVIIWDVADFSDYVNAPQEAVLIRTLLDNYSQMSIANLDNTSDGINFNAIYNYSIIGDPVINGSQTYEVNLTRTPESGDTLPPPPAPPLTAWFLENGTEIKLGTSYSNVNEAALRFFYQLYKYPFEQAVQEGYLRNQTSPYPSSYQVTASKIEKVGSLHVNATDFVATQSYLNWLNGCPQIRGNYTSIADDVGVIPHTIANISLRFDVAYNHRNTLTDNDTFYVISVNPS